MRLLLHDRCTRANLAFYTDILNAESYQLVKWMGKLYCVCWGILVRRTLVPFRLRNELR